ncbi:MAG TPA: hemerythrin domain-containing protein [Chitinophagales bacterium]|nr:hemerythrin domain-containing protein [Chitinophagales bacterium]
MKRHPAFTPLSRDHHRTLLLAQSIKKGAPQFRGMATTDEGKRDEIIHHYEEHLKDHFRREEKVFADCRNISPQTDELITEIIEEHRKIEELVHDLIEGKEITGTLNALGFLLEKHIRKEERQLFELLQEKLSEEKLNRIAAALL